LGEIFFLQFLKILKIFIFHFFRIPEYTSLDELCDFINSTDVSENKSNHSNCSDLNPSNSKIVNKKIIKKKVLKSKSKSSPLNSSIIIEENQVEEFKKFIKNNVNNSENIKKVKPKLSREWLDMLSSSNTQAI
jgi:hypothetical protein